MQILAKIRNGNYLKSIPLNIEEGDRLTLTFPFDRALIDEVKVMAGARWSPEDKHWTIDKCERNYVALQYLADNPIERYTTPINKLIYTRLNKRPYFEHQQQGIDFILQRKRCMLAFEMGLGKTLVGLTVMEQSDAKVWWLVAPYGAQREWERQLRRWNATVLPLITTTYESLYRIMKETSEEYFPDGVIFDESIRIKNPTAQRSQAAAMLCETVRAKDGFILLLSGAPAPKDPSDWWHQIECIQPGFIREGNLYKFRQRYANIRMEDGEFGTYPKIDSWKPDEVAKLGTRLAPIVLFKYKKDCYDLPSKIYDRIQCDISEEYARVVDLILSSTPTALQCLEKLRELSDGFQYTDKGTNWIGSPKIDKVKELLDFYSFDNGGCGRLVIYAAFHATIDKLCEVATDVEWEYARIDGRGWSDKDALTKFDSLGNNYVVIANPSSVHGLNLSRTDCLCYYSNTFSVDSRIQSLERRDRPGMNVSKGTRIVDLLHLPTDQLIVDKLDSKIELQGITLEEIKKVWNQ